MKIFEVTKPLNVHQPDAPADQEQNQQPEHKAKPQRMTWWKDYDKNPEDFGVKPNSNAGKKYPTYKTVPHPTPAYKGQQDYVFDNPADKEAWDKNDKEYYGQPEYKTYSDARSAHHKEMEKAKKAHYAKHGRFDSTITIMNPSFDPSDDDSPEEIDVGVDYEVEYSGEDRPATWDDPPEYAEREVYITRVVDLDTGEDITDQVDHDAVEKALDDQGDIMSASDYAQDQKDQAAIDRWEANRDLDEGSTDSLNRIKHLSGLK